MGSDPRDINKGVLFINDRKETDKQPDRKGSINIEGVEYWLSGWVKDKNGQKYLSLSATPKEQKSAQRGGSVPGFKPAARQPAPAQSGPLGEDDIPF